MEDSLIDNNSKQSYTSMLPQFVCLLVKDISVNIYRISFFLTMVKFRMQLCQDNAFIKDR
jgi:hypothetical protein